MSAVEKTLGPVFIVGMNGSGTTMLLDCLGRHPALYAFPREVRLIPFILKQAGRFNNLTDVADRIAFADWLLALPVFDMAAAEQPVARGPLMAGLAATLADCPAMPAAVFDRLLLAFAATAGKTRWSEKSPQNAQHIALLAEAFPTARFVHVIRDGRDAAASFHRRWLRDPELTIFRWKKVVRLARSAGAALPAERYFETSYETLTNDPEVTLRTICGFLDLPFDPVVLESSRPYLKAAAEGSGISRNSGNWKTHFNAAQQQRLETIAGAALTECDYAVADAAKQSDQDLSRWSLRRRRVLDALRQFGREVGLKLRGRIARPWRVILSKPLAALRQRGENSY